MFQVDPILWLQSFESPWLTWLMSTLSLLGHTPFYGTLIFIIMYGFNLRKGLLLFLALVIAGLFTDSLKTGLKFPRPSDIDVRVVEPGSQTPLKLVDAGGGQSFWDLPSSEAMAAVKRQPDWSYGFPSGHASAAAAFFLGLAFFFRTRKVLAISVTWVVLMAFSRMYLGRHFIADVIAGILLGALAVGIALYLVRGIDSDNFLQRKAKIFLVPFGVVTALICLLPFVRFLDSAIIGRLFGLLVTYVVASKMGLLSSGDGKVWTRIMRILIAMVLYTIFDQLIGYLMESTGWEDLAFLDLVATCLVSSVPFILIFLVLRRFSLYKDVKSHY